MSKLATRIKKVGWLFKGIIWSAFALLMLVLAFSGPKNEDSWSGLELAGSGVQGQIFYSLIGIMMMLYGLFKLSYILLLWLPPRSSDDDIEEQEEYYKPTALEGISGTIVYLTSSALYILFGVVLMYVVYAVEKENNKWSDRLFAHHPFLTGFLILCFLIACLMEGLKLAPGAFKKHLLEDQMSLSRKLAVHVTGYIGICGRAMMFLLLAILFCCLAANSDMDVTTLLVRLEMQWMGPTLFAIIALCFACFGAHIFLSLPYKVHKPGFCIAE